MIERVAFVFPGQGSQEVGMARALCEQTAVGKRLFAEAESILGFDLAASCFNGPEEALKKTGIAQPALFTHGMICCEWLREQGIVPTHTAGHSLGEYTALGAAGVFDFATGLQLVKARGEAMNQASEATKGVMSAILGLGIDVLDRLCAEAQAQGIVTVANINAPGQVVISGEPDAVGAVEEGAKSAGAKRVVRLVVHGAFHSPLMSTATAPMRRALAAASIAAPKARFVANTTGDFLDTPDGIREQLAAQITGCVRWVECIEALVDAGVQLFVELGPGNVLAGLIKRIRKGTVCLSANDPESLAKIVETVRASG